MLDLVLDEIGVLPDNEDSRDDYNDEYYAFWTGESENYKKLIRNLKDIRDERSKDN